MEEGRESAAAATSGEANAFKMLNSFSLLRRRVKFVTVLYLHRSGFYLSEESTVESLNLSFYFHRENMFI